MFLLTKDDIIISDPEAEYFPLVNRLGGQVIKLSPTSSQYINPMDINVDYSDEDVYCKGRLYHATKILRRNRLICSNLKRFSGKGRMPIQIGGVTRKVILPYAHPAFQD